MQYRDLLEAPSIQHIDQLPEPLHAQAVEAFEALAKGQRYGPPEKLGGASLYNKGIQVSGLYSGLTEHVGDITNRMAKSWDFYHGSFGNVREKIDLGLRRLTGNEIRGQVERNYAFMSHPDRDTDGYQDSPRFIGTLKDWITFWTTAGARYADAHAALTVWNEAQWHAREAAVSSGRLDFTAAQRHLTALHDHLGSEQDWITYAGQVSVADGQVIPYQQTMMERRRNPEQNPRETLMAFLSQYKDNPKMYLHTTSLPKVGIYPKSSSSHDSPAGIYAYRLVDIWERDIERWNTGEYQRGLEFLAYRGGDHLFILESDIDPDFPGDYTNDDLDRDINNMKRLYGLSDQRIQRLRATARTNQNFRDCPAGYFWGMTKALVAGVSEFDEYTPVDTKRWNGLLRKLGYVGFNDPGMGVIHGAEGTQALFLSTSAFRIADYMLANRRQKMVTIGDQKYKGGHLPRNLVMRGIPNTLFYNYEPADFAKVRSWTVEGMELRDLPTFMRFVPWNGVGIVKRIVMGTAANSSYEHGEVRRFFQKYPTLPKNIKVEDLHVGGQFPVLLINLIPAEFPVDTITIAAGFGPVSHGIDKLPPAIQAKIKVQRFR